MHDRVDALKNRLLNSMKLVLRRFWFNGLDVRDRALGKADPLTPPRRKIHDIGGGDFKRIGVEFLHYFIELANLKPHEHVLDVGCGFGRMAIPLTEYLSSEGGYWGFDINAEAVAWCQNKIHSQWRNFHFTHADIFNGYYNPTGRVKASAYRFPYPDASHDLVFLTSVFTHMLGPDMENYLAEIARVLRPAGRCLISYLLLNDESTQLISAGKSRLTIVHPVIGGATVDEENPEIAIGYDEQFVRGLYESYGLAVQEPIFYGSWCGREAYLSFQDLVLAFKPSDNPLP